MDDLREIFDRITEHHSMPLRIGSRCESNVYYQVEDLNREDLKRCASYITERIENVCYPARPIYLIDLHSGMTGLAAHLGAELGGPGHSIEVLSYEDLDQSGSSNPLKGENIVLVNEVITTARSCLEAHSRITLMGGTVLCWAALIDRTFGPGPVPVVAAFTGAPVVLVDRYST